MGDDAVSGKNFDHRKVWIEQYLWQFAAAFGLDLLGFAILSNQFQLILRTRPDVIAIWDDREVARRWMMLCPRRRSSEVGTPESAAPMLIRLGLGSASWCELVSDFGKLFCTVAGRPEQVAAMRSHRTHRTHRRYRLRRRARELFASS